MVRLKVPKTKSWVDLVSKYGTIGLEMGICVFLGVVFGAYLDKYLHTEPWLTIVFTLFGIIAGFKSLFKLARNLMREESKKANEKKEEQTGNE
jgi:ATP synthase protein I